MTQDSATAEISSITVGMTAPDLLFQLVDVHKEIETVTLMSYRVSRSLEERLAAKQGAEDSRFEEALKAAQARGVPLWIGLMNAYLGSQNAGGELTSAALLHDKSGEQVFELQRDQVTRAKLQSLLDGLTTDFALGVSSQVLVGNGEFRHIPMIDLTCEKSDENLRTLTDVFRQMGQEQGVLLDSGRSYHFYGLELLEEQQWLKFMGQSLLLTPLVDTRYIAHRLIDDYGRLRISTSKKKPSLPIVVAHW